MKRKYRTPYSLYLIVFLVTTILLFTVSRISYKKYQTQLVSKEQEQLLTIARTIGKSLVQYMNQELDEIDLYYDSLEQDYEHQPDFSLEKSVRRLLDRKPSLYSGVQCQDKNGDILYSAGNSISLSSVSVDEEKAVICGKQITDTMQYELYIAKRFCIDDETYLVLYSLMLDEIYRQIVAPVRIGLGGYSVVKDEELTIIMHHAGNLVGKDAYKDRMDIYPQLELDDLEQLVNEQSRKEEGTAVIRSYQWDSPELTPQKRIVAYTRIRLPGETWIVNSTLPYEELDEPLTRFAMFLGVFDFVSLLVLLFLEYGVVSGILKTKSQKKEIAYLKEINSGMELLCKKEEEIQHYQRVQSIGLMSSHIAHEFNNYLTPITVYGELLHSDPEITPEQKQMVEEILEVTEQAAGLSRKLLDFSRSDASVVPVPMDLAEELRKSCLVIQKLTPRDVTFSLDIPEGSVCVNGRKGMIEHILMNLSNNAFHAMEKNEKRKKLLNVTLTDIFTEQEQAEFPHHVCIRVSDTGCGISEEAMNHIFEPFFTTKRSGKGTGLGLSVISNLMSVCGGSIRVDSKISEGTTFSLFFPLAEFDTQKTGNTSLDVGPSAFGKGKLMIVDDDRTILDSLERLLKQKKVPAFYYNHPAVAMAVVQEHPDACQILLTDYDMPSLNGIELAEIIRKQDPKIRIVLMSGLDREQFQWYEKNRIIDEFVPKAEVVRWITENFSYSP